MNPVIQNIKEIPIQSILDIVGIRYKRNGRTLDLYEGKELTSGWKASLDDNIVSDFSHDRASGNPFDFIKRFSNFSDQEVVEWFKRKFPHIDTNTNTPMQETPKQEPKKEDLNVILDYDLADIQDKWNDLPDCTPTQINYLEKRAIDYNSVKNLVKDKDGAIATPIMGFANKQFGMLTIQTRSVGDKKFRILPGTKSKGVYMNGINSKHKHIYVVEGMFDYLTLRQYTTNVVGLKSVHDGIEIVKDMIAKGYNITLITDNDEPGRKVLDKFKDVDYYWYDIAEYGDEFKDLNDIAVGFSVGAQIIGAIEEQKVLVETKIRKDYEIKEYERLIDKGVKELFETQDPISYGYPELDKVLGYLLGGSVIVLGAVTGGGKSTFVNCITDNIAKQGYKVGRFTLEDRQEEKRKEEIYYEIGRIRKLEGLSNYPKHLFMANRCNDKNFKSYVDKAVENLKKNNDNIYDLVNNTSEVLPISQLEELVSDFVKRGCRVIIIDHLHYFSMGKGNDRHDLKIEDSMKKINSIARKFKVDIILVAHYKKLGNVRPTNESFKDANAVGQIANKILHIHREPNTSEATLLVTKNRGMGIVCDLSMHFDEDTGKYTHIIKM